MHGNLANDWWRRRRLWLPLAAVTMLLGATAIAWTRARATRVFVFNETGKSLNLLKLTACGQSRSFDQIEDGESVRFTLKDSGGPSELVLATNGTEFWRGEFVEPEGIRLFIHLRRRGEIDAIVGKAWTSYLLDLGQDSSR